MNESIKETYTTIRNGVTKAMEGTKGMHGADARNLTEKLVEQTAINQGKNNDNRFKEQLLFALHGMLDYEAYDALGVLNDLQKKQYEHSIRDFESRFKFPYEKQLKTIDDADAYFQKKLGISMRGDLEKANILPRLTSLEDMKNRVAQLELQEENSTHTAEEVIKRLERKNTEKVSPESIFEKSLV